MQIEDIKLKVLDETKKISQAGWRTVRFGDVVRNVDSSVKNPLEQGIERFVGLEHLDPESLHVERWGNVADGTSFSRKFSSGQVLFGKRRAYQRKAAVADFDGICSGDILVFEPKSDELLPELLPFVVQSDGFFEHALGTSAGSLSPRTKWSDLARYEFALPPKEEQRRIAEILWAADEVIEKDFQTQISLNDFTTLFIENFLFQGLPNEHSKYKSIEIGSIPENWNYINCSNLYSVDPRNGFSPNANSDGKEYPTLSIGAVRDGQIIADNGNVKYAKVSDETAEKFKLQKGDILVVRGNGNRNLVGRCGVVDRVPEGCFYPDLLIRINFNPKYIIPEFASLQWNTNTIHKQLLAMAKSTNGIWKVNGKDLRQHKLIVPPIEEQNAFLRLVEPQFKSAKQMQEKLSKSKELKKSLINELLSLKRIETYVQ